ncbi:MAG: SRPBCC family protein [Burkholderiales bacterium]
MDAATCVDLRVTQRFDSPPERVFDAWLDPAMAGSWLFATASRPVAEVEIDARVGGSFRFRENQRVAHTGKYLEIAPPRRLAFTLADSRAQDETRVRVEIVEVEAGCELTLTHENVPPADASRTEGRWTGMLYGLGTRLATDPANGNGAAAK